MRFPILFKITTFAYVALLCLDKAQAHADTYIRADLIPSSFSMGYAMGLKPGQNMNAYPVEIAMALLAGCLLLISCFVIRNQTNQKKFGTPTLAW